MTTLFSVKQTGQYLGTLRKGAKRRAKRRESEKEDSEKEDSLNCVIFRED
jgi:hypothetical protein